MLLLRNRINSILNSWFGVMLVVIALFFIQTPYFFSVFPAIIAAKNYVRLAVFLVLMICVVLLHADFRSVLREELLLWGCVIWGVVLCISMWINDKGVDYVIKDLILPSLVAILVISVFSHINAKRFLLVLFIYFLIINTINNASVMFFNNTGIWLGPYGEMSPEYVFFSHVNGGITCGINSILFGCLYSKSYNKNWDFVNIVNIMYSLFTAIIIDCKVQIITYIAAGVALGLSYFTVKKNWFMRVLRWVNLKTIMIFNVLVFLAVVVLGNTGWIEVLGMDPNMHSRRQLWDVILGSCLEQPILGHGFISWFNAVNAYGTLKTFWHQHSIYLQILYETGLIGAAIFTFIFVVSIRSLNKSQNINIRFIAGILVGIFFLSMVVDICERSQIFLLLAVCYYFPKYLKRSNSV